MKKILKNYASLVCMIISPILLSSCQIEDDKYPKIGVIQLVEHEALDEAYRGFIDRLSEYGYRDKENIKIDYQNAQGDQSNCFTSVNKLLNDRNDLIFAISTPAAQSAASVTKKVPILFSAVTDPVSANLVQNINNPGGNVTGVSDLSPIHKQLELIKHLIPNSKRLAILYCSNEANSKYQADIALEESNKLGINSEIFTVSQISEIDQILQVIIGKCDCIYTPTDNMIASAMPAISKIASSAEIPIICGDSNVVSKGALGSYGMDYYKLGRLSADQAVSIIREHKKPADIPVSYINETELILNESIIKRLNIKVPEHMLKKAKFVYTNLQ